MKEENNIHFDELLQNILSEDEEAQVDIEVPMTLIDDNTLLIKDTEYVVTINYQNGFNFDEFKRLYQEYFDKYDYIVGDWAHERLRLRGFYQINYRKTSKDRTIDFLDEYLKEYCNFGCAHFVVGKKKSVEAFPVMFEKYQQRLNQPISKDTHTTVSTRPRKNKNSKNVNNNNKTKNEVKNKNKRNNQKNNQFENFKVKQKNEQTYSQNKKNKTKEEQIQTKHQKNFIIKKKGK